MDGNLLKEDVIIDDIVTIFVGGNFFISSIQLHLYFKYYYNRATDETYFHDYVMIRTGDDSKYSSYCNHGGLQTSIYFNQVDY